MFKYRGRTYLSLLEFAEMAIDAEDLQRGITFRLEGENELVDLPVEVLSEIRSRGIASDALGTAMDPYAGVSPFTSLVDDENDDG